ncbi:hypothetical protein AVEN_195358-1 [Araneus ventricosus]|uniref:Uncharacterized protein n=1 Tax=Araneus ventricosus TaxID=182803 RepID=A0A4Y2DK45_ARAVE|nr:hypothetical protein AVEN_195358-1 [Araneus ventricosus]
MAPKCILFHVQKRRKNVISLPLDDDKRQMKPAGVASPKLSCTHLTWVGKKIHSSARNARYSLKPAIHFTDYNLEREKEKRSKSMEMSQTACGGWNFVWTEIGTKNQKNPEIG